MDYISNALRTVAGIVVAIIAIPITLALGLFTFLGVMLAGLTMALSLRGAMATAQASGSEQADGATLNAHRGFNGRYEI